MTVESQNLTAELARIKGAEVIRSFCYTCPWNCHVLTSCITGSVYKNSYKRTRIKLG